MGHFDPSSKNPHFQNEATVGAQPFLWKWVLRENEKWFPYKRLSTYPLFETEARGNSELAYRGVPNERFHCINIVSTLYGQIMGKFGHVVHFTVAVSRKRDSNSLMSSKSTLKGKVCERSNLRMQRSLHAIADKDVWRNVPLANRLLFIQNISPLLTASNFIPKLEYATSVWDPHYKRGIRRPEGMQRATARFCKSDYRYTSSIALC